MSSDHKPGDPAPHTGHYQELNVFGTETGNVVHAQKGDALRVRHTASRGG